MFHMNTVTEASVNAEYVHIPVAVQRPTWYESIPSNLAHVAASCHFSVLILLIGWHGWVAYSDLAWLGVLSINIGRIKWKISLQGAPPGQGKSWKVMEFRKAIFQKVMENSKGHGKSWRKMMIISWSFYYCTEQFCKKWHDFYKVKLWTILSF